MYVPFYEDERVAVKFVECSRIKLTFDSEWGELKYLTYKVFLYVDGILTEFHDPNYSARTNGSTLHIEISIMPLSGYIEISKIANNRIYWNEKNE